MLRFFQIFFTCFLSINSIYAQSEPSRIHEVKERIVSSLSETLKGSSQSNPILILIGGHVCAGKTTLSNAIKENYGMTIFSLNSIRQAMLDEGIDIRSKKEEERNILFETYPRLLAPCIANFQHIVIDANANGQGIIEALRFLNENSGGNKYTVLKICLLSSKNELYKRVGARIQQAGIHQGTRADLDYDLQMPARAIYPENYDLVIDTENTSFEEEMKIVHSFLQPYLNLQ